MDEDVAVTGEGSGPLAGVRVVELAALGPVPFAAMVLADLGADVVTVDRVPGDVAPSASHDPLRRGRRSIAVDLKSGEGRDVVLRLVRAADVLLEGFRPGVMEALGLGPEPCWGESPRLVYARMTGWGQDGPLARRVGHDINYLAAAGALHHIGREGQRPVPPLNLVGDFGGGGMLLLVGVLSALVERTSSGEGQVVDAAMVDGAALLTTSIHGLRAQGRWDDRRGTNLLDSGAPFYDTYETADGRLVAVGALERRFYLRLMGILGLDPGRWPDRLDRACWPDMRQAVARAVAAHTLEHWVGAFGDSDACFSPVLSMAEAPGSAHNVHRGTFMSVAGVLQPAPAPRFSRTPPSVRSPPPGIGQHSDEILVELGYDEAQRRSLRAGRAVV